jgi:hypothetical protein
MTGSVGPQWVSLGGQLLPGVIEIVHVSTTADRLFLTRDLLKNLNFMVGTVLMFLIGLIINGTLSLILYILLAENVQIVHSRSLSICGSTIHSHAPSLSRHSA